MPQLILIGPVCAGKTTLLPLLGERLGRPVVDLDDVAEAYYEEVGRGRAQLNEIGAARGDLGAFEWWQVAHPHAVRRVLEDHPDAVVALGAGHSTYHDDALFQEVHEVLAPHVVVLLLPSPDADRSVETLRARALALNGMDWIMDGVDILDEWVRGAQNQLLATMTVFTDGASSEELADQIAAAFEAAVE